MELLIRLVDDVHPDPKQNIVPYKRGEVIAACVDGWKWGSGEIGDSRNVVIRTALTQIETDALLSPPATTESEAEAKFVAKRKMRLDLAAIDAAETLDLTSKQNLNEVISVSVASVRAFASEKPAKQQKIAADVTEFVIEP